MYDAIMNLGSNILLRKLLNILKFHAVKLGETTKIYC